MRSQHTLNKKSISAIISSISACLRRGPTKAIRSASFSLWYTVQRGANTCSSALLFLHTSRFHHFRASTFHPRPIPNISLEPDRCKSEYEWKNVESCLWHNVSVVWFRSCSDFDRDFFFFFLCGGIERDKVKHTGIADKGDEATIGKCRIKTVLGKGSSVWDIYNECCGSERKS